MHYKRETELKLPSNKKKKKVEHFALFHTQKSSRHYISFFFVLILSDSHIPNYWYLDCNVVF